MANETELRVFVALINDAGQVLVAKRSAFVNNPGKLGLPGGHRDDGETVEQGARRELFEELGLDVDFESTSFIKVHVDRKRTILIAKMPPSSQYMFNIDRAEIESIYWMTVSGLVTKARDEEDGYHKSLELALPVLMDLTPAAVYSAFTHDRRIHLLEIE